MVNDVNEAPSFTLSLYSGEISENSAHGVDIITITAVDPDGGDALTYNLSGSGELKSGVGYIDEIILTLKKTYSYGAQLVGLVFLSVTTAIRMHTLWQVYCK